MDYFEVTESKNIEIADGELVELCQLTGSIEDAKKFYAKAVRLFEVAASNSDTVATFELANLCGKKDFIGRDFEY